MINTFFKQCTKEISAVEFAKFARSYLKISMLGAAAGGTLTGTASLLMSPFIISEGIYNSKAKTMPGQICEGLENFGTFTLNNVGAGMAIGGAPVTYPIFKLYETLADDPRRDRNFYNY